MKKKKQNGKCMNNNDEEKKTKWKCMSNNDEIEG
jgi:hypothetical protein